MPNWKKVIVSGSDAALNSLAITSVPNVGTDTDKFLVLDSSNNVDFRTGAEVRSDIGAGTGNGTVTGTGTQNTIPKWGSGGTGLQDSQITDNGTNVEIDTAGITKIGDISAIADNGYLQINGTDFEYYAGGSRRFIVQDDDNIGITQNINHIGDSNTKIGFVANDTFAITTAGSERIRVISTGNVGIGTITPDEKLTVEGNISGSGCIQIGTGHTNSGTLSSIAGGISNTVSGNCSFIGAGCTNQISNINGVIGGGKDNCVQKCFSTIAGGGGNCTNSFYGHDFIGGGRNNSISGTFSGYKVIAGGNNNTISNSYSSYSTIGGGISNEICSNNSTIAGGNNNTICSGENHGTIGGGRDNIVDGDCSTIAGGAFNCITANAAIIAGGHLNTGSGACSFIGGGCSNSILSPSSFSGIAGGEGNYISAAYNFIGGGKNNCLTLISSSIAGGFNNTDGGNSNVHILGSDLTADKANYTFVNNLDVETNIIGSTISLTGLANQSSEATAVMINGSNVVGTRELGSNAFNSTAFTTCTGTLTGNGTSGRVPIYNGTTSFTTDSNFTYSGNKLGIDHTLTSNNTDIIENTTASTLNIGDTTGNDSVTSMNFKVYADTMISIDDDNVTVKDPIFTGLSAQNSEATAVMINGSNVVGTRELGSNAFNSTAFTTCTGTVTGVTSANTNTITIGGTAAAPTVTACTAAVANAGTNLATGDQIYDHVTTRISGLTSCTGTVDTSGTPIDNDFAKFTDANTIEGRSAAEMRSDLNVADGATACTGTVTGVTSGNTNTITIGGTAAAPTVEANTAAVANAGTNLATGDQIYDHVTTRISGLTSCTGTVTGTGTNNRVATWSGTTSLDSDADFTYDGTTLTVGCKATIGSGHTNSGNCSTIAGGINNCLTGNCSAIAGGESNKVVAGGPWGFIGGGKNNCVGIDFSSIAGGELNKLCGGSSGRCHDFIGGGCGNTVSTYYGCNVIVGGKCNSMSGYYSFNFIGTGYLHTIANGGYNTIVGGGRNCISSAGPYSNNNFIGGGFCNFTSTDGGASNAIVSGQYNSISNGYGGGNAEGASFIGAGLCNTISTYSDYNGGEQGYNIIVGGVNNALKCVTGGTTCIGCSVIVGGSRNTGSSAFTFIGGGYCNQVLGNCGFIGGGRNNSICSGETFAFIGGGCCNIVDGDFSIIGSGCLNKVITPCSVIGGGACNIMCQNCYGVIAGGFCNFLNCVTAGNGCFNTIGGGCNNRMCAQSSGAGNTIAGGRSNCICDDSDGTIGGGSNNLVCNYAGTVAGGYANKACSNYSFIGGGRSNVITATGCCSGILGGFSNCVNGHDHSFVVGCSLTTTAAATTYMNNATVACHLQVGGTTTLNSTTGRIDATNDVVAFATSDRRLKCNIKPIESALCKVIGVSGNTFDWKPLTKEEIQTIHGNSGRDVGVIAQEIESILPEAVTTRDNGYKAVNYEKIVPLLIEAIKEQQKQIDELKSKV